MRFVSGSWYCGRSVARAIAGAPARAPRRDDVRGDRGRSRGSGGAAGGAPPGALLLGADYRALGAVRSLGRRGIAVAVLREPDEPLAALSRYARRDFAWPAGDEAARVAFLHRSGRPRVVGRLGAHPERRHDRGAGGPPPRALAEHFVLTSPAWPVLRWAYDKRLTYDLADRLDIAVPRTARPAQRHGGGGGRDRLPRDPQACGQGASQPAHRCEGVAGGRAGGAGRAVEGGREPGGPGRPPGAGARARRRRQPVLRTSRCATTASRGRAHRAANPPVPGRLRPREHVRGDRRLSRDRRAVAAAAARPAVHRPRRGGVQARRARRGPQAARHQPAPLGMAQPLRGAPAWTSPTCSGVR